MHSFDRLAMCKLFALLLGKLFYVTSFWSSSSSSMLCCLTTISCLSYILFWKLGIMCEAGVISFIFFSICLYHVTFSTIFCCCFMLLFTFPKPILCHLHREVYCHMPTSHTVSTLTSLSSAFPSENHLC